jgi:hypothetical protein
VKPFLGLVTGLVLLGSGTLRAEIHIEHVSAARTPYVPGQKESVGYPGDWVCFRYLVTGFQTNADGRVNAQTTLTLTDASGKEVVSVSKPWSQAAVLGMGAASHIIGFEVTDKLPPGEYSAKVVVQDSAGGCSASFSRPVTIRPVEWAISAIEFFRDPEGRFQASLNATLGEQLFYKVKIIGQEKDRVDCELRIEVLDSAGKDVLTKPCVFPCVADNAEVLRNLPFLRADGIMPTFTRPGKFTLRVTATDRIKNRTAVYSAPLKINLLP